MDNRQQTTEEDSITLVNILIAKYTAKTAKKSIY